MNTVQDSYRSCELIARRSGSNFYHAMGLLGAKRRRAMMALYAFARLADDATDGETLTRPWNAQAWHDWLDDLPKKIEPDPPNPIRNPLDHTDLSDIALALADSIQQFSIPMESLHDIVRGVDMDAAGPIHFETWDYTRVYCYRVASSVGIACLSIWSTEIGQASTQESIEAAIDCGIAFQITNILRDVVEDAGRKRIYLPADEFRRFQVDTIPWLAMRYGADPGSMGDWQNLVRIQIERAAALYESGWRVIESLSNDGQRMFSLMWHTYRSLLRQIEDAPKTIWQRRVRLTGSQKIGLAANHLFSPLFQRLRLAKATESRHGKLTSVRRAWPSDGPAIAVIGAGLGGISTAMHLARHGCRVTLMDAKHRIGGRVGSFLDSNTGQAVDYCQHVGMNCCKELKRWIEDTNQADDWDEHNTLHFRSAQSKPIAIRAWPLPAPFHLAGLLWKWPELKWQDRMRVGLALWRLQRMPPSDSLHQISALEWLQRNGQNQRCIDHFWSTILVSALGEQVHRVTLGATRKVLVDGFATDRTAFHLLVPTRPWSELLDGPVRNQLNQLGVRLQLGQNVRRIERDDDGTFTLNELRDERYSAVVSAVPWHRTEFLSHLALSRTDAANASAAKLESSPITGVHTWWDRAWLPTPHAILINRLCQWVFPAPDSASVDATSQREHYYQIVISASRELPRGDSEALLESIRQDLSQVFPEAAKSKLIRGKIVSDPHAVFSVTPGHEASRLACNAMADSHLWLAGDWTQTEWPATMEGALRSGALAAQGVLQSFGRDAKLLIS